MPRVDPLQASFNAGEFGPQMLARTDFSKYRAALRKSENVIALPQGGVMRRPCTRYVVELKSSAAKGGIIPFEFSTTQAYIIETGNLFFRFIRNQGQITSQNITASITNGTFTSNINNWTDRSAGTGAISHDSTNGRLSLDSGGSSATNQAHAEQQVTNASAVEHILRFRVYGAVGDEVKLRIGTSSTGTEITNDLRVRAGFHAIAFTATAADFYVQFVFDPATAKSVTIDDVELLDNTAVEIVTPYTTAQLPDLRYAQSADVLYICHSAQPIYKLIRRSNTSWSLEEVDTGDGPYLAENTTATTLTPAAATGRGINFTMSSLVGVNDDRGFLSTDVGRPIRYSNGTNIGYGVIVSITSTTVAKVDIYDTLPATTAQTTWRLGAWSGTTGYPTVVTFHEQRLVFANTTEDPDKYWLSQTGDFENYRPDSDKTGGGIEVQDDDALDFRISSDQVNAIQWMKSGVQLMIGTTGGEWVVRSDGPTILPTDIDTKQQTSTGSASINPIQVDNAVIYAQRGKRQVHEFAFNFEADGFRSPDLTILSPHITKGRISKLAYAAAPYSLVLVLKEDGRLAVLTYKREQDVVGWSRWTIGGTFSSDIAVVEDIAVIPGTNGAGQVQDSTERDEIWMIVKRTIDGDTKRYIEVMEEAFEGPDRNIYTTESDYETDLLTEMEDMYFSDSLVTYDSTASGKSANLTGYTHITGETAKVLADGAVHPDVTVDSNGEVTLDYDASVVQVGLSYFHDIEFLKLDFGNPAGSAVGKNKTVNYVDFVLHETGALKVGEVRTSLREISLREVSDSVNTAIPLFTGELEVEFRTDYIPDPRVIIRGDEPTALTILAAAPSVNVAP